MAANLLPIIAIAGAAFFLMKKKDEPTTNGNGNGNGETPNDVPSGPHYVVVPVQDKPRTFGFAPPPTNLWFRFEGGGKITEWTLDGPDGSGVDEDVTREGGVGSTKVDLQIKKVGMWRITTTAKDPEGGADIERMWDVDLRVLHTGADVSG